MATSKKHGDFVRDPMGRRKDVTSVAGIGYVAATKLKEIGFVKAHQLFGQFLVLDMNEESFSSWLNDSTGLSANHVQACYNCLKEYADTYFK
jgi:hypothetical protein